MVGVKRSEGEIKILSGQQGPEVLKVLSPPQKLHASGHRATGYFDPGSAVPWYLSSLLFSQLTQ